VFHNLIWAFILQQVKLCTTEGDPAAMNHTINNLDENDGSSPESSPNSPRDQMFDANPPYSQVLIRYVLRKLFSSLMSVGATSLMYSLMP
jgi:hypothetical protein